MSRSIELDLFERHGPLIANDALRVALGYLSMAAFRQALVRGTVPVPVFTPSHRRGKYALVKDVAEWLVAQRNEASSVSGKKLEARRSRSMR